ncbi:response regulator [Alteromonas sp. C1M14]|uniref:response regulator transcription factor n=1 Tax=Alteromonas sp. C1M14 TaxID=2841567 RepID=UPI001C09513C|nr:response regulator [Alteromonas sp. C1M14]MBU2977187.1 response regulator [Alteromonas sp. C1M14]
MTPRMILRILVVEDDPVLASPLTSYIAGLGWDVDFAASGKLALRFCAKTDYDAIVVDEAMPDLSGAEICNKIKAQSDTPVLLMTSNQHSEQMMSCNADDCVADPSDYREIAHRCQHLKEREKLPISA